MNTIRRWMLIGFMIASVMPLIHAEEPATRAGEDIAKSLMEAVAASQMAVENSRTICPAAIRTWADGLKPSSPEVSAQLQKIAETLGAMPDKISPTDQRVQSAPTPKMEPLAYARYMCPRWLISWAESLQEEGRKGDCAIVAQNSQVLSGTFLAELGGAVDPNLSNIKAYTQAMVKAAGAQADSCLTGSPESAAAAEQAKDEALRLQQAVQLDSTAQPL